MAFLLKLWIGGVCTLEGLYGHSPLKFFLDVVHEVCIVTEATGGLVVCSREWQWGVFLSEHRPSMQGHTVALLLWIPSQG